MKASADRPSQQGLARIVSFAVLTQLSVLVLSVALVSLRGRFLGPEGFGVLSLALILPTFMQSLLNLGVARGNTYYIARGEVNVRQALRATLRIWLAVSVIGCIGAGAVIAWYGPTLFPGVPQRYLWLSLAGYPLVLLQAYNIGLLQGVEDFRAANRIKLLEGCGVLLLTAAAFVISSSVLIAIVAYLVSSLLLVAASTALVARHANALSMERSVGYSRRCIQYGWKANLNLFLRFLNFRLDVLLINFFLDSAAAGLYMGALIITEKLCLLPQTASGVIFPRLTSMHRDEDARDRLTRLTLRLSLVFALATAAVMALVSRPLLTACFGAQYSSATIVMLCLLPGMIFETFVLAIANDLAARGRVDLNVYRSALLVAVNFAANLVLIPRFGIIGAALASTLAYFTLMLVSLRMYGSLTRCRWWTPIVPEAADYQLAMRAVGFSRRAGQRLASTLLKGRTGMSASNRNGAHSNEVLSLDNAPKRAA